MLIAVKLKFAFTPNITTQATFIIVPHLVQDIILGGVFLKSVGMEIKYNPKLEIEVWLFSGTDKLNVKVREGKGSLMFRKIKGHEV